MKDSYIRIRCSERDKELIKAAAEKHQMSMSEYILYLTRKEEAREG